MGLIDKSKIDIISYNESDNLVTLSIIDALEWDSINEHLYLLQEKINVYLSFIESGEIYSSYEQANGSYFEIKVYFKNDIPKSCYHFLEQISNIIKDAGFKFSYQIG